MKGNVSEGQALPLPDSPLIRKIPVSEETLSGRAKQYVYMTPCCKCGKKLSEKIAWEAIAWKTEFVDGVESYRRQYRLLCSVCAKRAIRHYEKNA